ncbi:hypothetical protein BJ170DRAFT_589615 [Xylariales sp. AK1849]|nr:hypothetical protein BJ170DRAFT_589615 [Xylariales sp. AK1849]
MAPEKGAVATEAPPLPSSTISQPSISVESLQADATRATASLKRARQATPPSPTTTQFPPGLSPSKVARLAGLVSTRSPAPLTGAAALEDERRGREEQYKLQVTGASENPAYKVQADLMSAVRALGMSRPQDAPTVSHDAIPPVLIPTSTGDHSGPKDDTSPQSVMSLTSLNDGGAPVTASPGPMDVDPQLERPSYAPQPQAQMEEKGSNTSFSYPGLVSTATAAASAMPAPPARGMSMPMTPGQTPKSPNSKKHKCPYCETEFTRHHNLKSHLLTHSQEKPYACTTCQMRFRRLHDLKRHSKLHTGEKPHICPKCDRKFARGDALARHSKGPGGCVSRRGSLPDGEEYADSSQLGDDSVMSGIAYDGSNEGDMAEEERRRLSLPSIKAQQVHSTQGVPEGYAPTSRTYPPALTSGGRLFPPNVEHGSVSSNASHAPGASISSIPPASGNATMYSQTGMTESPKPLSPGIQGHDGNINRQRSPSLTTQFQQQHFGRHQTDRQTPPGSSHFSSYPEALVAQLVSVPGFTANDGRYAASGQSSAAGAAPAQAAAGAAGQALSGAGATPGGAPGPTSNVVGQNGGSGDSSSNNIFATDQGIWAYIHSLEENIKELAGRVHVLEQTERTQQEKITQLTDEVTTLRSQVAPAPETIV